MISFIYQKIRYFINYNQKLSYLCQIQKTAINIDAISCTDYFWIKQSTHKTANQRKLQDPKTFVVVLRHLPTTLLHMPQEPNCKSRTQ